MPSITITNNGVPAVPPTTGYTQNVTIEADNGVGTVNLGSIQNNGNVPATLTIDVSSVVNGTFTNMAIDNPATGGVSFFTSPHATMVVPVGQQTGVTIKFAVTEPAPGSQNPSCTATYTAAWSV